VIASTNSSNIVITLGAAPVLHMTGTFSPSNVAIGSPSGIEVKSGTTIMTASSSLAVAHGQMKDVGSNVMPGFFPSADMVEARGNFPATVMNDGRVLVTGGMKNGTQGLTFAYKNETYDPVANAWTQVTGNYMATGGYTIGRFDHTQTLLPNGKVLIAGGYGIRSVTPPVAPSTTPTPVLGELSSAFLFNPVTNLFELAGPMNYRRESHYATLLPNGQVLISGGFSSLMNNNVGGSLPACELYDPTTNVFTTISTNGNDMKVAREAGTAHVVNGNVLFAGGHAYGVTAAATTTLVRFNDLPNEVMDMTTKTSTVTTVRGLYRRYHGSVDVAGGFLLIGGTDLTTSIKSIEKFDATAGTYTAVGNLNAARSRHGAAKVGNDLLVIGGVTMTMGTGGSQTDVMSGELYNTTANVSESYQLVHGRNSFRTVTLQSGRVLAIGGFEGGSAASAGTAVRGTEFFAKP